MRFKHLFSAVEIGSLKLKNRLVMAPLGLGFYNHGFVTETVKDFYKARAGGGVGMIIAVSSSVIQPPNLEAATAIRHGSIYNDGFISGWKELVDLVHEFDVKIGLQLIHYGRQISYEQWGEQPVSSSAISCPVCKTLPHELSLAEIDKIIEHFVEAARRCKLAGFDLIEIHGAHGYLGTQFLSPYMNKRVDEYGSNAEGRVKFIGEIIQRIKKLLGQDFVVGVRINGQDNIRGGGTLEDAKEIAILLEKAGADYLSVSASVYGGYPPISPMAEAPGCYVYLSQGVKSVINVPVITVGKIDTPQLAESILKEKSADLVAIGRPLLADPEFANKAAMAKPEKIRKCIYCNQGCIDRVSKINFEGEMTSITCLLNPEVGKEEELKIRPARLKKTVLVVGGGPGGLEAARVSAARGHRVILYEKEDQLGGQFILASVPPTKQHYMDVIDYFRKELQGFGAEIILNREGIFESVMEANPEVVIIATGARPAVPDIEGVENDNVATYDEVLSGRFNTGKRVMVMGGGSVGLETADFLSSTGKTVWVVEMLNRFGADMGSVARFGLRQRLREKKVELVRNCKAIKIIEGGAEVVQDGQKRVFDGFDAVILAVGSQSRNSLFQEIKENIPEVYIIGDAQIPRSAMEAIYEGAIAGRTI